MRMTASWFRSLDLPHTRLWRDSTAPESGLPSDCHPDCIIVLEAVSMSPGEIEPRTRRWKNASPCLTQKAPYKGLGAESEEKREPASDIDTGVVDSLKALDPDGRLEKRTINKRSRHVRLVPLATECTAAKLHSHSITSSARASSEAVPAATEKNQHDDDDDQKCRGVHAAS